MHFYRRWLNLHIASQLRVGLVLGLEVVKMHVAEYIFGPVWTIELSNFRIISTQLCDSYVD